MIGTLAFRHLLVRKRRSLLLLLGYGLGVGVMIVLLSVGAAMLEQSRDVSLVGGGEVTVLPQGIDVEAMRTGGVSGMFFGIDRARLLTRQLLAAPRQPGLVRAVSPALENKLVYLSVRGRVTAVRAGGEIPSRAAAVGAGIRVLEGEWRDHRPDSAWMAPTPEQLYDEIDHFHLPSVADSSWGEWHYFNVVVGPREWWYITYLVGGRVMQGRWGGQLLISHRRPDGGYERFSARFPADVISLDTTRADLALGENSVRQQGGVYHLIARARGPSGEVALSLRLTPEPNRYFPPVELREDRYPSGYVVPALSALASGTICLGGRCRKVSAVPAYHDHNWGVWRNVTWDWGSARGTRINLLYGAVYSPDDTLLPTVGAAPRILVALVDSLGVRQILRAREVSYTGAQRPDSGHGVAAPTAFSFVAARDQDTVRVSARISDFQATDMTAAGMGRSFLQMRGTFMMKGVIGEEPMEDVGEGFFETYLKAKR